MFVPLYNFYWQFVAIRGLAAEMNRHCGMHSIPGPPINVGLGTALCIIGCVLWVPYLGMLAMVAYVIVGSIFWKAVADKTWAIKKGKQGGSQA